ncbi:precorrin-6y C5,15-methyltransferase (decarboxylating) subunit CbiE [Paramaledivibacter caminithermalis]|jgi:cobalt-precorrin-7 (C5)-methyltransferase|uniref:Precorrin-6Y C5,15-methyltransferase (Decarboxylating) n=1 Tax=Paramaledivibacter caminithermalis (strain DSM 15212 / CIP 107654 / DViRD3) TaxID=1121301 RepID=A0A1M6MLA2_PARC5|nr:precorrin-6y C5,15-methyltransferase (decarboxylating) subunit CbiE [Paramaledivibacter caminithermalis]SHJ84275.1 precorrin-6Y C5,15-methyltransferase (decarboxylating) [Paramaledivibacter caminithermalis DSM 15212]
MSKIYVLGMGPGHRDYILPITLRIIDESDVLIGGKRILKDFEDENKELIYIDSKLKKIIQYIKENKDEKKISLLLSGDTGFYSMLDYLKKYFKTKEMEVIPGISSYQYLMGKLKKTWQKAFVGSVHGRELDIINLVKKYNSVILLTDNKNSPSKIADILITSGIKNKVMIVGENLSYDNERIIIDSPENIVKMKGFSMCVVVIENHENMEL